MNHNTRIPGLTRPRLTPTEKIEARRAQIRKGYAVYAELNQRYNDEVRKAAAIPQHDLLQIIGIGAEKPASTLLALPGELRNIFYEHATKYQNPIFLDALLPLKWMVLSPQMMMEATPMFFRNNAFVTVIHEDADWSDTSLIRRSIPATATRSSDALHDWLAKTVGKGQPAFRDVRFRFIYDDWDRDNCFRLQIKNNRPVISHGHCVLCDEDGYGDHIQPFDLAHPRLNPENMHDTISTIHLVPFRALKIGHDSELDQLHGKVFPAGTSGVTLLDIERIAKKLRSYYGPRSVHSRSRYSRQSLSRLSHDFNMVRRLVNLIRTDMKRWDARFT